MQKNKYVTKRKGSQQQSRRFHKCLEHEEDEIILTDKAEQHDLHPKTHTEEKEAGEGGALPWSLPNQSHSYK